ncbi:MAG: hypothetical protein ACI9Y1_002245 [Lentisphaeria bacterium]|jgi:hypothetical protein
MPKNSTTKKIDRTLEESSKAIDDLKLSMVESVEQIPSNTLKMEKRLHDLQNELDSISGKMLAYKLRRLADSKILQSLNSFSAKKHSVKSEATQESLCDVAKSPSHASSTFRCKSDLDQCLVGANTALEKALCYALFIRCAIKG